MGSQDDSAFKSAVDDQLNSFFSEADDPEEEAQNPDSASAEEAAEDPPEAEVPPEANAPEPEEISSMHIAGDDETAAQIQGLKSVILQLEWEITDQVMQRLGEEIGHLEESSGGDKIITAFLQLLGSLGKYIRKKKSSAHPESINLLNSVFSNLETVMLATDMSDAAKKKLLVAEVNKYKRLKEKIAHPEDRPAKSSKSRRESASAVTSLRPPSEESMAPEPEPTHDVESEPSVIGEPEPYPSEKPIPFPDRSGGTASEQEDVLRALESIRQTIESEFRALREELRAWRDKG